MDQRTNQLHAMLGAADRAHVDHLTPFGRRRHFSVELDRRGLFLRLGRTEAYLCGEPEGAWYCRSEPGGVDAQAWRLHLVVGRVPSPVAATSPLGSDA